MKFNLPQGVSYILDTLNQYGFEAFIVGGCVRDMLMGAEPHDWDVTTDATPNQVKECFGEYKIIETGLQHGTVTIMIDAAPYEVTTYRVDGEYLDNRHPSKIFYTTSLQEDLSRRDFTVNAMAYNPQSGLIDRFGGRADLNKKQIQCVGKPDTRFHEDALRMMRALRFASVLGFEIASETGDSIMRSRNLLPNIALERISVELSKLLCGKNVKSVLLKYADVLCVFIPEIAPMIGFDQHTPFHYLNVWEHSVQSVSEAIEDSIIRLAMFFHDIGKPHCYTNDGIGHFYGHPQVSAEMCFNILKRLKFDSHTINTVRELILYHDAEIQPESKTVKRWLFKIGEERLRQLIHVKFADAMAKSEAHRDQRLRTLKEIECCLQCIIEQGQCFTIKDLKVNGKDLIAAGVPQGVQVGTTLNQLVNMVIDEKIENEYSALIKAAKKTICSS